MLTSQENEMMCRVGPGTPMGTAMRRFWLPAVQSSDLPDRDFGSPACRAAWRAFRCVPRYQWPRGNAGRSLLSSRRLVAARAGGGLRNSLPLPRLEVRGGRHRHGNAQCPGRALQGALQGECLSRTRGGRADLGLSRSCERAAGFSRVAMAKSARGESDQRVHRRVPAILCRLWKERWIPHT